MNILIRVDCSKTIGMGHLVRCMTLAVALRELGCFIVFIMRALKGNRVEDIRAKGFDAYELFLSEPLDENMWEVDALETIKITKRLMVKFDWLIVDHYMIDLKWEKYLREHVNKIMVVDDLADRYHDCDLLLDQNFYTDQNRRYCNLVPKTTTLLLGPEYSLIRKDFLKYRELGRQRDGRVRRILIFFGGGDYASETINSIKACFKLNRYEIDIIVGMSCSQQEKIREICSVFPTVRFFCQVENVAELMMGADLSIGAGGSTIWERCCLGLPSIVMTVADNQRDVSQAVATLGVIKYLGDSSKVSENNLTEVMENCFSNPKDLCKMADTASKLVDGLGSAKVIDYLMRI